MMPYRADMRMFQGHNCDVLAIQRNELHFIRLSFVMNMDDNADITGSEFYFRYINRQHDTFMFFYHGRLIRFALGYAVISLGEDFPRSICQMVRTLGVRPSGVLMNPSTV